MVYGNNSYRNDYITEDYLQGCTPINVIPSYVTIDEMAFYVIESAEQDFNDIMMETGIKELQYFEATGKELVTEAKSFGDKVAEWFEKTWRKVQEMIQKATNSLAEKAESFKKDIIKKVDKNYIQDRLKNVSAKKDFGSSYDFAGLGKDSYTNKYYDDIDKLAKDVWDVYDAASAKHKAGNDKSSDAGTLEDKIDKCITSCVKTITGSTETSTSSVINAVKSNLRGSTKDWKGSDVKENYDDIKNEVMDFNKSKRTLKQNYNTLKRQFNDDIKKVKSARDSRESDTIYAKAIKGLKTSKSLAVAVEQGIISVINERYSFYRSIMLRLLTVKKVKESASVSTSDTVDSLFNW